MADHTTNKTDYKLDDKLRPLFEQLTKDDHKIIQNGIIGVNRLPN